jgi:hypothetical protein
LDFGVRASNYITEEAMLSALKFREFHTRMEKGHMNIDLMPKKKDEIAHYSSSVNKYGKRHNKNSYPHHTGIKIKEIL